MVKICDDGIKRLRWAVIQQACIDYVSCNRMIKKLSKYSDSKRKAKRQSYIDERKSIEDFIFTSLLIPEDINPNKVINVLQKQLKHIVQDSFVLDKLDDYLDM